MSESFLPILQNPAVQERVSPATRRALEDRATPAEPAERFLSASAYSLLQEVVDAILPQSDAGTTANIAATIDQRLSAGKNSGWRFAVLPADGEAYRQGLKVFADMLKQTPAKSFSRMLPSARESYLRCIANGDVDGHAGFALSKWLGMLRTDAVKVWLAHPSTMLKMEYYGFADGATGQTDGPTVAEGWSQITTNRALPFEQGHGIAEEGSRA